MRLQSHAIAQHTRIGQRSKWRAMYGASGAHAGLLEQSARSTQHVMLGEVDARQRGRGEGQREPTTARKSSELQTWFAIAFEGLHVVEHATEEEAAPCTRPRLGAAAHSTLAREGRKRRHGTAAMAAAAEYALLRSSKLLKKLMQSSTVMKKSIVYSMWTPRRCALPLSCQCLSAAKSIVNPCTAEVHAALAADRPPQLSASHNCAHDSAHEQSTAVLGTDTNTQPATAKAHRAQAAGWRG